MLAALLWPATSWGQACLTYRTEDCPNKNSLKRWGGKGTDPPNEQQ